MNEQPFTMEQMEFFDKLIQSAVDRSVHSNPSAKTLELIDQHKEEDRNQFKEIRDIFDEIRIFMERGVPVIEAYEFSERRIEDAKSTGRVAVALATFVSAMIGVVLLIKQLFN